MSFEEYYNIFTQKKEKSQIKNVFFLDLIKRNFNYGIQTSTLN